MGKQKKVFHGIRFLIMSIFAILFTAFITAYYLFATTLKTLLPKVSVLGRQCTLGVQQTSKHMGSGSLQLWKPLQVIINSTISLLMVLMITDYAEHFLDTIGFISHQTHQQFICFLFPTSREVMVIYRPAFLSVIIIFINYLGITAQLALAMDFIYIFNLPTILLYKGSARAYGFLITCVQFLWEVLIRNHSTWLTVNNDGKGWMRGFLQKDGKVVAFGLLVVFAQFLIVVGFYYIWLALVITVLVIFLNLLKNLCILLQQLSKILLIFKGLQLQSAVNRISNNKDKIGRISKLKNCLCNETQWVRVVSWRMVKGIAVGEDIFIFGEQHNSKNKEQQKYRFSPFEVYRAFMMTVTPFVYTKVAQQCQ